MRKKSISDRSKKWTFLHIDAIMEQDIEKDDEY